MTPNAAYELFQWAARHQVDLKSEFDLTDAEFYKIHNLLHPKGDHG